jgi:hypothetical protein
MNADQRRWRAGLSPRRHRAHRDKKERPIVNSSTAEDAEDAETDEHDFFNSPAMRTWLRRIPARGRLAPGTKEQGAFPCPTPTNGEDRITEFDN